MDSLILSFALMTSTISADVVEGLNTQETHIVQDLGRVMPPDCFDVSHFDHHHVCSARVDDVREYEAGDPIENIRAMAWRL